MSRRPNIVWIFPDEWRHDAAGYAGNPVVQTPHLDALAGRGTAFTRAYCESPVCAPSRASLLTGTYPRDHGKYQNPPDAGAFPLPDAPSFLHALQAAGYRTAQAGKLHFFDRLHTEEELRSYGFDLVSEEYDKVLLRKGFMDTPYTRYLADLGLLESWRAHQDEQTEIMFGRDPQGRRAIPEALDPEHSLDAFVGRRSREMVRELAAGPEPFFLWSGFVGPHLPFDGPAPFADRYDPAAIPLGPLEFDGAGEGPYAEYVAMVRDLLAGDGCDEQDYRLIAKHYYASISLIDAQVGALVDAVEEAGVAAHTWFLFSSDHGELLGDHGLLTKGVFYESSVRVPVLVVPPAGVQTRPLVVDELVQGIDVPATILDLAGAELTGGRGRSLRAGSPGRDAVFSQIDAFTMVVTRRHKLVVTTGAREPQVLYDLVADPGEHHDLLASVNGQAIARRLLVERIGPFLDGREDPASASEQSAEDADPPVVERVHKPVDHGE